MESAIYTDPQRRHDFVLIFEVKDGNPNGDPDAGNLPRVDPETMQGLVTDVCLKRKVRDWVDATRGTESSFKIYVQNKGIALNEMHERAYTDLGIKSKGTKEKREVIDQTRAWMCRNFYDIRTFGAVMTTKVNCGQVRGPVQLTFARSVDAIVPLDLSITRVAITLKEDAEFVETEKGTEGGKTTEMGRKAIVPYGLYLGYGFFNPHFGEQTGFTQEDLILFWQALTQMWDLDRSASRGQMACRGLYVFSHDNKLGKAPAHKLFDLIQVQRKAGVASPRKFQDYEVSLPAPPTVPEGITFTVLEG
ncbi:MAG: type I-C CRISPR-associated protein Cas7/Csd2 [Deltaproteobacteria bacterium]|nr:type I-C CRISPR-associated protein Cas7/Csd2 [Deltaproteobacteria bacterium]